MKKLFEMFYVLNIRNMKRTIISVILLVITTFLYGQEYQKYMVFTFNNRWTSGGWNTGDFLWAVPYDSCYKPINVKDIIPLFVEDNIIDLDDPELSNQSFGEWPTDNDFDYIKKNSALWHLLRNRRLIHKIEYKYSLEKRKRTTNIYMVPIIAKCSKRQFGFYKEDIYVLEDEDLKCIWEDFWDKKDEAWIYILQHDFCGFDFIVSPGWTFKR